MVQCSALGCSNRSYSGSEITYHRYPKDISRRRLWINLVNRKRPNGTTWHPGPGAKLCSKHFLPTDFFYNNAKTELSPIAVPSHFPDPPPTPGKKKKPAEKQQPVIKTAIESLDLDPIPQPLELDPIPQPLEPDPIPQPLQLDPFPVPAPEQGEQSVAPLDPSLREHCYALYESPISIKRKLDQLVEENTQLRKRLKREGVRRYRQKKELNRLRDFQAKTKNEANEKYKNLMAKVGRVPQLIMERASTCTKGTQSRQMFPPEIQTFAVTLYRHSTSAYRYMREVFQFHLPTLKTVRLWNRNIQPDPERSEASSSETISDSSFGAAVQNSSPETSSIIVPKEEVFVEEEDWYQDLYMKS